MTLDRATSTQAPLHAALPPPPSSIEETGLEELQLVDLVARSMHYRVRVTPLALAESLHLSRLAIEELLSLMREEALVEVVGPASALDYYFGLTSRGRRRAGEAFERTRYVGPAPVPFDRYLALQAKQSVRTLAIAPEQVRAALARLVQPPHVIDGIGAGVVSTGSVLLYGPSGNGKSTIAAAVREMLPGAAAVPYALDIDGHIVRVFDARVHERMPSARAPQLELDPRFAICRRPLVTLGSALSLRDLELHVATTDGASVAPPQLKANGGVLVIDDLGRQLVRAEDLLNRWIGPMGSGVDQLVLPSGRAIEVPFDVLLVFATNLDPAELGDEAFERRIRHKVHVDNPTPEEFLAIMRIEATQATLDYDEQATLQLLSWYRTEGLTRRGSHPGDIVRNLLDMARFRGVPPALTAATLIEAAQAFFTRSAQ